MTPEEARELAELGERGRECLVRRTRHGTAEGAADAGRLQALPPVEAAAEVMAAFAFCPTEDLANAIAGDLRLDPAVAKRIAQEIQAARQRLRHATRPFRPIAAED